MDEIVGRQTIEFDPDMIVDLDELEQQIARLWRPQPDERSASPQLTTRPSVLNLIAYASDAETRNRVKKATEHLSAVHPCRVIFFSRAEPGSRRGLRAALYTSCDEHGGQSNAPCIERIEIPIRPSRFEQLPTLVQPLVIPELPAFLWWPGSPPFEDTGFIALARAMNRTVLDSLSFSSARQLADFSRLHERLPVKCAVADLNWQRLQPWRELTAQFFDIRHVQWALSCVREIEIEAGEVAGNALPSQALLFVNWLAHCLSWKPFEARRTRNDRWYIGFHDQHGKSVQVIIRARPTSGEYAGHMLSLSMNAKHVDGATSTLSLSRSRGSALIRMHATSGTDTRLHHAAHHPVLPDEALLIPVLESTSHDHIFEAVLTHAAETMELFGRPEAT